MSTALPAAPRRATDAFGSTQFQAVDRYQYGDGFVDRANAEYSIRTAPDGPPLAPHACDAAISRVKARLRSGRWSMAEHELRQLRNPLDLPETIEQNGPALSEADADFIGKVLAIHLKSSNATTAANAVRGWLIRGWFARSETITARSDFRQLDLCTKTMNALDAHWEKSQRPTTVGELSAALDEWLANPAARPRTIANAAEAEIRDELLRVELLGPAQRANGKRCGQGMKKSEVA